MRPPRILLAGVINRTHAAILTAIGINIGNDKAQDLPVHIDLPFLSRFAEGNRFAFPVHFTEIFKLVFNQLPPTGPHKAF